MNKQSNIESDMLPFTMRELVSMVMQRKTLALEDALYYIYSSEKIAFRNILHRELSGNKKYICKRDFTTIFRI